MNFSYLVGRSSGLFLLMHATDADTSLRLMVPVESSHTETTISSVQGCTHDDLSMIAPHIAVCLLSDTMTDQDFTDECAAQDDRVTTHKREWKGSCVSLGIFLVAFGYTRTSVALPTRNTSSLHKKTVRVSTGMFWNLDTFAFLGCVSILRLLLSWR